jgi:hypothetical protein
MKSSDSLTILLFCLLALAISKYSNLKASKTRLQIHIIEDELSSAQEVFEKMLIETQGQEINWGWSGIGNQKTVIDRMQNELAGLKAKRKRLGIFFF